MAADLDFSIKEFGIAIDDVVNGIRTDPAIVGKRGEYARLAVVNAFSVWKQAFASLQKDGAMATTLTPPPVHLFEANPSKIIYTPLNSDEANTAIQNASLLIKKITEDIELARWMANALLRHANQKPATTIGTELRTVIGDLTAFVAAPRRISTEYDD